MTNSQLTEQHNQESTQNLIKPFISHKHELKIFLQYFLSFGIISVFIFDIKDSNYFINIILYIIIVGFISYIILDQKKRKLKIEYLYTKSKIESGFISEIEENKYGIEKIFSFFKISQPTIRICFKSKYGIGNAIFYKKKLYRHFPNLKIGSKIKILVSENYPEYYIWDFETTYFNINKNYKGENYDK